MNSKQYHDRAMARTDEALALRREENHEKARFKFEQACCYEIMAAMMQNHKKNDTNHSYIILWCSAGFLAIDAKLLQVAKNCLNMAKKGRYEYWQYQKVHELRLAIKALKKKLKTED